MAKIFWAADGADIHIVAGVVFDLNTVLIYEADDGTTSPWSDKIGTVPGVSVTWATVFSPYTKNPHGFQMSIDGVVDADPSPPVRSFMVRATVVGLSQSVLDRVRVRIHDKVTGVQLTPRTLHIPVGARQRFTVLATFQEGTAGDVTRQTGLTWARTSGSQSEVSLDPDGFLAALVANKTAEIKVTLPANLTAPGESRPSTASRTVTTVESWARDVQAEFVGGAGEALYADTEVRNVLFVPDGFAESDRTNFNNTVSAVYEFMIHDDTCKPLNLCLRPKGSLNMFKAWIPSHESGGTILNALKPREATGTTFLRYPVPEEPKAGQTHRIETLYHLLWQVGPPTPADVSRQFVEQRSLWLSFYGAQMDVASDQVLTSLWLKWKALVPEVLTEERDTALGMAVGKRPQLTDLSDRSLLWHPSRTRRADLNKLLENLYLKSEQGNPPANRIGRMWGAGGKDRRLVFVLVNAPDDQGTRTRDIITAAVNVHEGKHHQIPLESRPTTGGEIARTVVRAFPAELLPATKNTIPHELGHAFSLGDEYAEVAKDMPDSTPFTDYWNLHRDRDLIGGTPPVLTAANIRWDLRWKRIRAAGVLKQMPTSTPGSPMKFTFVLRPGQGAAFGGLDPTTNPVLRLRLRPLVGEGKESPGMILESVSVATDTIVGVGGAAVKTYIDDDLKNAGHSADEVILMAPVLKGDEELGVMHKKIGDHITLTHLPLNRTVNACTWDPEDPSPVQFPVNLPASAAALARHPSRIIGLYDGGNAYGCRVYHPQGICLMRSQNPLNYEDVGVRLVRVTGRRQVLAKFCHVCRYIIVDQLQPTLHGEIDADYASQYPDNFL
jgi:hypothetical protein